MAGGDGFWLPLPAAADLAAHLADASDAHDASAISYAGGTGMSATDVEAALDELATEKANLAGGTFTGDISVPDEAYDATNWNGSVEVPTKNAVRDKIESLGAGGAIRVEDEGSTIVAAATGMNFAGAGVVVTDAGSNEALVTISGGGSGDVATDVIWDAKGDLAGGTGSNTAARLAVGTNGFALLADSAETTGLKWVDLAGTYVPQAWRSVKRKTAVTSRNTTITVTDDPHLTFAIGANEVWVVRFDLWVGAASNTPDFKWTVAAPAGATGTHGGLGFDDGVTGNVNSMMSTSHALGTATRRGVGTWGDVYIPIAANIENGANAGTVSLQWAQNTSSGSDVHLRAGSFMTADRIA